MKQLAISLKKKLMKAKLKTFPVDSDSRRIVIDLFWRLTNQDFNIRLVDVKNEKTMVSW